MSETTGATTSVANSSDALGAKLAAYVELARPAQWIKNVVVLAAPAAGLKLLSVTTCKLSLIVFFAFCLAASSVYALNDVIDRKADARHPTKRNRPIARGAVAPAGGLTMSAMLVILALAISEIFLSRSVTVVLGLYLVLTLLYSFALKRRVILDVVVVAIGFVLRALAGALAVDVQISQWLIACVFTLCLFLGFGKRRCESVQMESVEDAQAHRKTLLRYTPHLLTHLITVSAGIAIITFLLYTIDTSGPPSVFPKGQLFYTLPIVVYGIFRFAMLTETGRFGGPTEIVLKDPGIIVSVIAWTSSAMLVAYQFVLFGDKGLAGLIGFSGT